MRTGIGRLFKTFLFSLLVFSLLRTGNALSVCQCSTVSSDFMFTNTHESVQHYSIRKGGQASSWTIVTPQTFTLNPGESIVVVAFTKVDCGVNPGVYSLRLKAVSEDDIIEQSKDIIVSTCHSISVDTENTYFEVYIALFFFFY